MTWSPDVLSPLQPLLIVAINFAHLLGHSLWTALIEALLTNQQLKGTWCLREGRGGVALCPYPCPYILRGDWRSPGSKTMTNLSQAETLLRKDKMNLISASLLHHPYHNYCFISNQTYRRIILWKWIIFKKWNHGLDWIFGSYKWQWSKKVCLHPPSRKWFW